MGKIEIDHTGANAGITLSSDGTDLLLDGTAIGGGTALDLFAENPDGATAPSATGSNALSLGSGSTSTGIGSVSIGTGADATGNQAYSFGVGSTASGLRSISWGSSSYTIATDAIAIGSSAQAQSTGGMALGHDATVISGTQAVAIGDSYASGTDSFAAAIANNASSYGATGNRSVAIGSLAKATGNGSVAISANWYTPATSSGSGSVAIGENATASSNGAYALGTNTLASATFSYAFGYSSTVSHSKSIALGTDITSTQANQIYVGGAVDTVKISEAYTLPTADGTANQVLTTDGSGAVTFADAGGGGTALELYAENPVTPVSPSATGTNAFAIGSNSLSSGSESIALGKSIASGTSSFSVAVNNSNAAYGASAANTLAIGQYSRATSGGAIAIGSAFARADGSQSVAIGRNVYAQQSNSVALGYQAIADVKGKLAYSGWNFAATGDSQYGLCVLRQQTTDATATVMLTVAYNSTASAFNQIILPNNSAYAFSGTIVARQQASAGTASAAWKIEGLIRREGTAGTTVLVNSATTILDNTPAWGMALTADTTNGGLAITVTGAAATNIRWVATINTSEVTY
jgi:hypothetical protein